MSGRFTGGLPILMTNDYLFRAVMQENNRVLKALVCSLLHLNEAEVHKVLIQNPIELGRAVGDKDFFLDIRILLDNRIIVNLELQVINEKKRHPGLHPVPGGPGVLRHLPADECEKSQDFQ